MKHAFVLAILFILPITVQAATIYVPDDYGTIQAAIDASADDDTVIVRPGTYVENIKFNGKAITLRSEQGPEVTIIDGDESGTVVKFNYGEGRDSVLDGFTIQNGVTSAVGGGGVSLVNASSPVIKNNIITGNTTERGGGGIRCNGGSSPLIMDNTITNNNAGWGGGILCSDHASPGIRGNTLTGNIAGDGGGIYCEVECSPAISGNTLANNTATINGGGICCYFGSSPHICGNTIDGNIADYFGGGIYYYDSSPLISGNTISNNSAGSIGGIGCYKSTSMIINNTVSENTSTANGGGISLRGDVAAPEIYPALVVGNTITGNVCFTGGGGVQLSNSSAEFRNNVVAGNTATTRYGGGIVIDAHTDVLIANCTIAENSATLGGGGIGLISGAKATVTDTILWGNSAPTGKTIALADESSLGISFSDVDGGEPMVDVEAGSTLDWGLGNILENPEFAGGSDGDYFLGATSPCIDAGDEDSLVIGGTTSSDQAMDVGIIDMGYHYPGLARLLVGPGSAETNPPQVRLLPLECMADTPTTEFSAYGASSYGVNVGCGDVDDDHHDEILTGAGPGDIYGPHVRGFEVDGTPLPGLSFLAYGTYKYGVNVAAGDLDGDGYDEIITGPGPGAVFGPHVRGWNYDGTGKVTSIPGVSYFAYGTPKWGVNVACGDIDGDGFDEIVTGAGPGAVYGPHVRGWNFDNNSIASIPGVSYFAYGTLKYGVNVACGDIDGDGIDEIITGAGPGAVFSAHVRGWNVDGGTATAIAGFNFFAWPAEEVRFGANVFSGADLNGNGRDEIVVGQGPDPAAGTWVKVYLYDGTQVIEWLSLEAFEDVSGERLTQGVNVAAGHF